MLALLQVWNVSPRPSGSQMAFIGDSTAMASLNKPDRQLRASSERLKRYSTNTRMNATSALVSRQLPPLINGAP